MPASVSMTHLCVRKPMILRGRTTLTLATTPLRSTTMIEIGLSMVKVWIDRVRSITGDPA